jgi:hypothetical protein
VQVNADATRAHFGDGRGGGVQKPGLVSLFSDPMGSTYWNPPTKWKMTKHQIKAGMVLLSARHQSLIWLHIYYISLGR